MNTINNDKQLWRKLIIDHYSKPINKRESIDKKYQSVTQNSNLCVDNFQIGILIENNIIKDGIFNGLGCAISTASIDLLIEILKDKSKEEAIKIINDYLLMLDIKNKDKFNKNQLGNLIVFSEMYKQPNRIKCASIGANGIMKLLNE